MSATFFFAFFFAVAADVAAVLVMIEPATPVLALTSPVDEEDEVAESVGEAFRLVLVGEWGVSSAYI